MVDRTGQAHFYFLIHGWPVCVASVARMSNATSGEAHVAEFILGARESADPRVEAGYGVRPPQRKKKPRLKLA
jgi:hypothetical protein